MNAHARLREAAERLAGEVRGARGNVVPTLWTLCGRLAREEVECDERTAEQLELIFMGLWDHVRDLQARETRMRHRVPPWLR